MSIRSGFESKSFSSSQTAIHEDGYRTSPASSQPPRMTRSTFSHDTNALGGRTIDAANTEGVRPRFHSESPSLISSLMKSTAENAANLEKEVKNSKPDLNILTTTPKNFSRFVARVGPLVSIQELVIDLLTWRNPSKSMVFMLCYTVLCLYPLLLVIVPQAILIGMSLNNYYRKTRKMALRKSKYNQNIQYLKNMQFIQNFMGQHADLYDLVSEKMKILHWDNEQETLNVLKWCLVSVFVIAFLVILFPLRLIALVGGLFVLVRNTPLFQAASTILPPVVLHSVHGQVEAFRNRVQSTSMLSTSSHPATKNSDSMLKFPAEVLENQRWWSGGLPWFFGIKTFANTN